MWKKFAASLPSKFQPIRHKSSGLGRFVNLKAKLGVLCADSNGDHYQHTMMLVSIKHGDSAMSMEKEKSKFSFGLSTKIITITFSILVAVVAVNYVVFLSGYRKDVQASYVDRASGFTAVADAAKNSASEKFIKGDVDSEELLADALEQVDNGTHYSKTRFFKNIPVIVGWEAAANAAEKENVDFKIVSLEARNPDNAPASGGFRDEMIKDLTTQYKSSKETILSRVNPETNTLHYMRAITLDESCMMCHGDPAVYDERDENGNFDGKDALGFRYESWTPGYMHGAYEVQMPLGTLDASVTGFFAKGMTWTIPIVIVTFGGFMVMMRRMVAKPMANVVEVLRVAGEGDLTKRIESKSSDEMGILATGFNAFLENMVSMVTEIRGTSQAVASASTEIAASADEMASGLQEQETQTQQVAAAVEELSQSVTEVAAKSSDATQSSEESQHLAEEGGSVVRSTVEEMQGIATEVNASAQTINALGVQSEKIGEIIAVINDIADQTNLLALNAAIEAARAGEHGRGFAVVADEVRKLAERTTQATEEVSSSIRGIQGETISAVAQIEAGSERVGKGVDLANQAGSSLETIVTGCQSVQGMVQDIAAAANQQASASDEIARAIENISSVTRQSSEGAGQASQAAGDLAHQAEQLMDLVGKFKVD
jgi:methyl-accepting chemotaxis protein